MQVSPDPSATPVPSAHRLAALLERDPFAWSLVAGVSLLTFVCLAAPGRFPGVDLAEHALMLRRLLEGGSEYSGQYYSQYYSQYYVVDWTTPYLLFYALAAVFTPWLDPVGATWLATSLAVALLPVSAATLSVALGRSPALGLFALLGAFSSVVAWGFASLVLGASMMGFTIAAALAYGNAPTARRGSLLAGLLGLTYFAHSVTWLVTVFTCWFVVIVWLRTGHPRRLWPLLVSTLPSAILMVLWSTPDQRPWLSRLFAHRLPDPEPTFAEKLQQFVPTAAALGHPEALLAPWSLLAVAFVAAGIVGVVLALRRHTRERSSPSASGTADTLAELKRITPPLIWLTCLACYFIAPLWLGGVFLVYPRFILLAGVLAPAAILASDSRAIRSLALAAALPAVWLSLSAGAEVESFARSRACIDELTSTLRADETLLSLPLRKVPPGYALPLDLHIHAEMAARRGGFVGMDFVDFGAAAVVYRKGVDRLVVPPNVNWSLSLYDHARQGGEFSAWIVQAPADILGDAIAHVFEGPQYRVTTCGDYGLVQDMSVEPGTLAHVLYLPHSAGHSTNGCQLGDHHVDKLPIGFARAPSASSPRAERDLSQPNG